MQKLFKVMGTNTSGYDAMESIFAKDKEQAEQYARDEFHFATIHTIEEVTSFGETE